MYGTSTTRPKRYRATSGGLPGCWNDRCDTCRGRGSSFSVGLPDQNAALLHNRRRYDADDVVPRPNDGSSTYPCAVRSWNVTRETGSSQRSSADLLILARTIEPSRCANSTISPAWARMTETASAS